MDKYDEIANRLMAIAGRNRDIKQIKAQAEIDAINREYEAYVDGLFDMAKAIRQAEKQKEG